VERLIMTRVIKKYSSIGLSLLAVLLVNLAGNVHAKDQRETLYTKGSGIYTAADELLVMRGFNEMFVWSNDKTGETFLPQIAMTGANSVRLVWDHDFPAEQLVRLIENALALKMVAIPECHNATGKWGEALQACVDFWNNPLLIETIERHRRWTILNIANEAGGHGISDEDFLSTYSAAIRSLRSWGYTVPIMVDASIWGQHIDQLLRVGPELLKADPLGNVIFSAHSYWGADVALDNYKKAAITAKELGIAMVIGEGPSVTRVGQCDDPKPLPYLEGMQILEEHQTGWLNWSWGGMKNGDCDDFRYFDITRDGLFGYWWHEAGAQIVALSPYSVMQTSRKPASFYEDGKVKVAGIYLHLDAQELKPGQLANYQVILAPANANNKKFTLTLTGDKGVIKLDKKRQQLKVLKPGKARLTAEAQDTGISWSVDLNITQ
jgi:mannan endo-1,4-beta-mannosidase